MQELLDRFCWKAEQTLYFLVMLSLLSPILLEAAEVTPPLVREIKYSEGQCDSMDSQYPKSYFCIKIKQILDYSALASDNPEKIIEVRKLVSGFADNNRKEFVDSHWFWLVGGPDFAQSYSDRHRVQALIDRVLVLEHSTVTAGANINDVTTWLHFDLATGQKISLDSLLTADGKSRLKETIATAISLLPPERRRCINQYNPALQKIDSQELPLPKSFMFEKNTFTAHYQRYELGSRVCGEFTFVLKLSNLSGVFRHDGQWRSWRPDKGINSNGSH